MRSHSHTQMYIKGPGGGMIASKEAINGVTVSESIQRIPPSSTKRYNHPTSLATLATSPMLLSALPTDCAALHPPSKASRPPSKASHPPSKASRPPSKASSKSQSLQNAARRIGKDLSTSNSRADIRKARDNLTKALSKASRSSTT